MANQMETIEKYSKLQFRSFMELYQLAFTRAMPMTQAVAVNAVLRYLCMKRQFSKASIWVSTQLIIL